MKKSRPAETRKNRAPANFVPVVSAAHEPLTPTKKIAMTRDQIRNYIDHLGVASRIDDDGDIVVVLDADQDFGHNVTIWVLVSENRLSFIANAEGYRPQGDLLYIANRHNDRRNYPTAVVRGEEVRFEYSFFISEEVSDEYITICIRTTMSSVWSGFRDLEKETLQ